MAGITVKRLDAVQKSLEAVFSEDAEQIDAIQKSFDGLRAAIAKGDTITMDDISDILGEVVVEKTADTGGEGTGDEPADPIAPIIKSLHEALFDNGSIRKGLTQEQAETHLQKAYEQLLKGLDDAIDAAIGATIAELGDTVTKAKPGKKPPFTADPNDQDCDDMEKLLKGLNVPAAVIKKVGDLQKQVDTLTAAGELERFEKRAVEIGEPKAFAVNLLKMHQADPEAAEAFIKHLASKNELLKKSKAWGSEIGADDGGAGGASALSQLNAKATEMVQKGDKDSKGKAMTFQKAFTEACHRFPELYGEYRREKERR